ncbi:MAG: hypothetical protein JSU77_13240 [Fidelibacterota bacterium]|nr:MAG: hypothetical protein JSU77_13240 [Candidatus Neomarinimicrobiota bacterium]
MKRFLYTLFTISVIILGVLHAQNNSPSLLISANAAMPAGDFGEDIGEEANLTRRAGFNIGDDVGLAQPGFSLGAELYTPVGFTNFDWILSARAVVNSSDISAIEETFEHQLGDTVDINFEFGNWINIPVMTGFRYNYPLTANLRMYGLIQAGINVTKAASRKAIREIAGKDSTVEETTFDFTRDFGYEFGLGVELAHKFNIGFRYLALNSPRYQGTRKLSEKQFPKIFSRENAILGEQRSISIYLVTLGYYLF